MPILPFRTEELGVVETDLSGVLARFDITLTNLLEALRGIGGKNMTTLEADLEALLSRADIAASALRDALRGDGGSDLTSVELAIDALNTAMGSRNTFSHGHIMVVTAGTPVRGPAQVVAPGKAIALIYHPGNTGLIGIGNSAAAAHLTTGTPVILAGPGQALSLFVDNLNLVWFDSSANGGRVMWAVET